MPIRLTDLPLASSPGEILTGSVSLPDTLYGETADFQVLCGPGGELTAVADVDSGMDAIFGHGSLVSDGMGRYVLDQDWINSLPLSDSVVFRVTVLACFAGICFMLYYFRPYVSYLFSALKGQQHMGKLLAERSSTFEYFLFYILFLGVLCAGCSILRTVDIINGISLHGAVAGWAVPLLAPAVCLAVTLAGGLQYTMLKFSGMMTGSLQFTDTLWRMKQIIFSVGAALLMPFLFVFSLDAEASSSIFLYAAAAAGAFYCLWLSWKTFTLFVEQKVSILFWFLYLCAVEIFPVSICVLLVLKNT